MAGDNLDIVNMELDSGFLKNPYKFCFGRVNYKEKVGVPTKD